MKQQKLSRLHRCSECNDFAKYLYMPSNKGKVFFCEKHVPRGCSCNVNTINELDDSLQDKDVMWWSKEDYENLYYKDKDELFKHGTKERKIDSFYFEILDENGLRNPCCEYRYDEDGYEIENKTFYISKKQINTVKNKVFNKIGNVTNKMWMKFCDTIENYTTTVPDEIDYCEFMHIMETLCHHHYFCKLSPIINEVNTFYNSFKSQLVKEKYLKEKEWQEKRK